MIAKRHGDKRIPTEDLINLYVVGLKTLREIGKIAGMTAAGVSYVFKQHGVEYRGGKIDKICPCCGGSFEATRCQTKKGRGQYCSVGCYSSERSLGGDMSVSSRHGRAAFLMANKGSLKPGQVIHHKDGDRNNNSLDNLQVFDSQREHMQYHHSIRKP